MVIPKGRRNKVSSDEVLNLSEILRDFSFYSMADRITGIVYSKLIIYVLLIV